MRRYGILILIAMVSAHNMGPFTWQVFDYHDGGEVSIEGQDVAVFPLLQQLYQAQQKNVVFISAIKGHLSLALHHLSLAQALEAITISAGYCVQSTATAEWVGDCKKLAQVARQYAGNVRQAHVVILRHITLRRFLQRFTHDHPTLASHIIQRDDVHNRFTIEVTPAEWHVVEAMQHTHDRARSVIRITAYIMSIDTDYLRDLGVEFAPISASRQDKLPRFHTLLHHFPGGIADMGVALHAVEQSGHGTILSSPELVTLDGYQALIETGNEIPYQERQDDGKGSLVFKKAVLSLQVKPTIESPGHVHLHIVIQQDQPGKSYTDSIAIQTRKIVTDAAVASKSMLVLGGIMEKNQRTIDHSIPVIGDIPWLGSIFHAEEIVTNKRQLCIFISPDIIDA